MTHEELDIVRVYAGSLVNAELYQQTLRESGIESKVVGEDLSSGIMSAFTNVVELWVKIEDAEKAKAILERFESERTDSPAIPQ